MEFNNILYLGALFVIAFVGYKIITKCCKKVVQADQGPPLVYVKESKDD